MGRGNAVPGRIAGYGSGLIAADYCPWLKAIAEYSQPYLPQTCERNRGETRRPLPQVPAEEAARALMEVVRPVFFQWVYGVVCHCRED